MKLALLLALIAFMNSAAIRNGDGVQTLGKDSFKSFVTDNKHVLVNFYLPRSPNCKSFEPEYIKAAEKLKDIKSDIKLAKVDVIKHIELAHELAEKHKIRVFPTLKFFCNGKPSYYNGGLTGNEIVSWLLQKSGHAAKAIGSFPEAKEFISSGEVFVLGLIKDLESDAAKQFLAAASKFEDILFGFSSNAEVLHQYRVSGDSSILLFNEVDDSEVVFKGDITTEAIVKFIMTKSLPLVIEFNRESSWKIFGGEIKNMYYFLICVGQSHKKINQIKSAANQGAKAFKGKVMFMTVDTDDVFHQAMLEPFGMKKSEFPAMLLIHHASVEEITKYKRASVDLTEKKIKTFVQAGLDGRLKPYLLSEELPMDWDKSPVKTLVSNNFDQVAFDKTKDVLVEFYAPPNWCDQCKQLDPVYIDLAEKYKEDDSIVIAKINFMANNVKTTKITRLPAFKLYQKGDNKVITLIGQPSLEGLSKFIDAMHKKKSVVRQEL